MQNTPGKFNMRWAGPYLVTEKKSKVHYKLEVEGIEYVTHVDRMKLFRKKMQKDNIGKDKLAVVTVRATDVSPIRI